jgi:hypothetical protein
MVICKSKSNISQNLLNLPNCEFICENKPKNADLRVSSCGNGWKFGAPHAKVWSNPALFSAGFGRGKRQRLEVLL